jgi:hypothetical protein
MIRILCSIVLAMGMFSFVGCGAMSGGDTIVKYENGGIARMAEATKDGTYALYSKTDTAPRVQYLLVKGDKLGFSSENGKVYGVAGSHKDEIVTGTMSTYYWKLQPEKK